MDALPDLLASIGVSTGPLRLTGHSAGGHLVLWLAATGVDAERVVPLAPVCDLGEAVRLHLGNGATTDLMGDLDPAVADPMVLLSRAPRHDGHDRPRRGRRRRTPLAEPRTRRRPPVDRARGGRG